MNPDTDSSHWWKTDPTATLDCGSPHVREQAAIQSDMSAFGRFLVTKKEPDTASFKTPDLRNVLMMAPYFHDGSQATLWDVMDHYNKGDTIHNPMLGLIFKPCAVLALGRKLSGTSFPQ